MSNLIPTNNNTDLNFPSGIGNSFTNFANELLAAVPFAIASPILSYQRTKEQSRLAEIALNIRKQERADIMETMRILAIHKQLTPELYQLLMVAYGLPSDCF